MPFLTTAQDRAKAAMYLRNDERQRELDEELRRIRPEPGDEVVAFEESALEAKGVVLACPDASRQGYAILVEWTDPGDDRGRVEVFLPSAIIAGAIRVTKRAADERCPDCEEGDPGVAFYDDCPSCDGPIYRTCRSCRGTGKRRPPDASSPASKRRKGRSSSGGSSPAAATRR